MNQLSPKQVLVKLSLLTFSFGLPTVLWATGEAKPGPNGGEVRTPGAFHVELKVSGREIWVYLLDNNVEKPRTDKSSVSVDVVLPTSDLNPVKLDCRAAKASEPPRFVCTHSSYEPVKGHTLKVRANRGALTGQEVSYLLPIFAQKVPR